MNGWGEDVSKVKDLPIKGKYSLGLQFFKVE
jgi:hypothetical protein